MTAAAPLPVAPQAAPVLSVRGLTTRFRTDRGVVTAVDDVSFDLFPGQTLGIVGESGCGKTVTSKSIMRLLPERTTIIDPSSQVLFEGINLATADERTMRKVRGDRIAMIFQEPMTSLNPVFTVGWQIEEALKYHRPDLNRAGRRDRAVEMLRLVEIPEPQRRVSEYPHQLSGGMRQRVMIAIALCCEPDILIADEPTTALDVTVQAQILALMDGLRRKLGTAIVIITHNLGVVAQVCDRVMVMYAGRVIETGAVHDIFHRPRHPYTRALLESIPRQGRRDAAPGAATGPRRLPTIEGIVPSLFELPKGCRFQDRCAFRQQTCIDREPALEPAADQATPLQALHERAVRCHFPLAGGSTP
jgi:oligopeptide/dipeptide ABC transporter ATP-binding protein